MFESNKDRMQIRSRNQPWFNWRKTKRWQDLCAAIFKRDSFTCQCGCGQQAVKADLVCGHVAWHAGNEAMFWDPKNLRTMLRKHHVELERKERRHRPPPGFY
jgi:hypothetical protein